VYDGVIKPVQKTKSALVPLALAVLVPLALAVLMAVSFLWFLLERTPLT
jgi:hypothetical protein